MVTKTQRISLTYYISPFMDEVVPELLRTYQLRDNAWLMDQYKNFKKEGTPINWAEIGAYAMLQWGVDTGHHERELVSEFKKVIYEQLRGDEKRFGETWRHRSIIGQEDRTFARFKDYVDQAEYGNNPMPWAKVFGGALICRVRERWPELILVDA